MKKWSVTSVTPATCNRRGEGSRAQPSTQQGHHLLYAQVTVCAFPSVAWGKGARRSAGPPPARRLTAQMTKALWNKKGRHRVPGSVLCPTWPLFQLLSGADRDFI